MKKAFPPLLAVIFALAAIAAISCSSGNPVTPAPLQSEQGMTVTLGVSNLPNRVVLGYWNFSISGDRSQVEATPLRSAAFHLNAVNIMEHQPTKCISIAGWQVLPDGRMAVDVQLIHPYPGLKKYTAFDTRGIVITGGDYLFQETNRYVAWGGENLQMIGPDGYTALFNPTEFPVSGSVPPMFRYTPGEFAPGGDLSATLNPFLYYFTDKDRRNFGPGDAETNTMYLRLPPGPLEFGYAVDASWMPIDGDIIDPVEDFPISANCTEASQIYVSIGKGLTMYGTDPVNVMVEVFDWQGLETVDKVMIEAPDLFPGEIEAILSTVTNEGLGGEFYAKITNELHAPVGDYPLLVEVTDTYEDDSVGPVVAYNIATAHVTPNGVWLRELITIPAGDFLMGSDPDFDPQTFSIGETPQHLHPTGEYLIGKYELTCAEFAGFIADGGYHNPQYWSEEGWTNLIEEGIEAPPGWNEWPNVLTHNGNRFPDFAVYFLTWFEANAFCTWAGGRLPSEAEWEKAARGTDGRIFPWGNDWDPYKCNGLIGSHYSTEPVGTYSPQGDSLYGLCDSVGNVREWVNDWLNFTIYDQYALGDFTPPSEPWPYEDFKGLRGGDWGSTYATGDLRCADRYGRENDDRVGGFRIVFDP